MDNITLKTSPFSAITLSYLVLTFRLNTFVYLRIQKMRKAPLRFLKTLQCSSTSLFKGNSTYIYC